VGELVDQIDGAAAILAELRQHLAELDGRDA